MKHKQYVIALVAFVILGVAGSALYVVLREEDNSTEQSEQAQQEYVPSAAFPTDEEIESIDNVNERYRAYLAKAQSLDFDQKVEAYDYYIIAYKVQTDEDVITQASREQMIIDTYDRAVNNSVDNKAEEIKSLVGEEKINSYLNGVEALNQEFNE